jgi:hypothetical protein
LKRIITIAATAALAATLWTTPAQATNKTICSFQTLEPGVNTITENKHVIWCMARKLGVDPSTAIYVAGRESGYDEWAFNGSCGGLFQHMLRYWPARVATYSGLLDRYKVKNRNWYSPRANTLVAMAMVRSGGWAPWSTAP